MTGPLRPPRLSAWRFVATFGVVSLLADFVYEGARSITGPLLASLGATGLVVGVVTGIGEAAALGLRLVSGPLTDRTRRFWSWTIAGYTLTVVSVPLLGVAAVLWVACALVIAERVGKAVRSPAKDALLAHATHVTGRGRGFAVHEALDQFGAVLGPLTVAAVLACTGGDYAPALGVLALPGIGALVLLIWLRRRAPDPALYEDPARYEDPALYESAGAAAHIDATPTGDLRSPKLPRSFWAYCVFTAVTMTGFATFGLLGFHMVDRGVVPAAAVPLIYAAVMGSDAVAALASGWAYDRIGARTLAALPVLIGVATPLAFGATFTSMLIGALLWGAAVGIQESTLRAFVADLVAPARRATAYGIFAAALGVAVAAGGALTGWLYDTSTSALIGTVVVIELTALALAAVLFHRRQATP